MRPASRYTACLADRLINVCLRGGVELYEVAAPIGIVTSVALLAARAVCLVCNVQLRELTSACTYGCRHGCPAFV